MKAAFRFEVKRIFSGRSTIILLLFFLLAMYLTYVGTARYKSFMDEKEKFISYEAKALTQYVNYEQYGAFGFRVLMQPSPLTVFCHSPIRYIESRVNLGDLVAISSVYKGQRIFLNPGMTGDFSNALLVLGSLLMIQFGFSTIVSTESICFPGQNPRVNALNTFISRLAILTVFFSITIAASYFFARILGITIPRSDTAIFAWYSLYILLFLIFIFCLGFFLGILLKARRIYIVGAYLAWFLMVFAIPMATKMWVEKKAGAIMSNESVNLQKMSNRAGFERSNQNLFKRMQNMKVSDIRASVQEIMDRYLDNIIPLNNGFENRLSRRVDTLVTSYENGSVFIPPAFFYHISREIPGAGYNGYRKFLTHIMAIKQKFFLFYFENRYNKVDQTVTPFIRSVPGNKNGPHENIFKTGGMLPGKFRTGVIVTLAYSIFLAACGFVILAGRLKKYTGSRLQPADELDLDMNELDIGKAYFFHSNIEGQNLRFIRYLEKRNAVVIGKPESSLYDAGTTLGAWLRYITACSGLDYVVIRQHLKHLEISGNHLKQKIKNLDNEFFAGAFLAVSMARYAPIYVFDNFLDRVSKRFEKNVKQAMNHFAPHAVLVYVSSSMYDLTVKEHQSQNKNISRLVAVDPEAVILR